MGAPSATGRQLRTDALIVAGAWFAARLPLLVCGLPPLVQVDSFCHRPLPQSLAAPHYAFGYGTFLSMVGPVSGVVVQHLLLLAAALALFAVARAAFGRVAGLATGLFVALYGGFVLYAHTYMSETLFNFFLALHLAALWLALARLDGGRVSPWFLVAGLLAGLSACVRPVGQYLAPVLVVALTPFYLARGRRLAFAQAATLLIAGAALVVLPVCGLVYHYSGRFAISAGLPKAAIYRLVDDPAAPLARVQTDDPQLAATRDYLAARANQPGFFWQGAYAGIRTTVLGLPRDDLYPGTLPVDPLVNRLWRAYVRTYPLHYLWRSAGLALDCLFTHESFLPLHEFSQTTLASTDFLENRLKAIYGLRAPSPRQLDFLNGWFTLLSWWPTNPPLLLFVLVYALATLRRTTGVARQFLIGIFATAAYVYLPQFLVSIVIVRYRYPFDLVYSLLFGVVCMDLLNRWRARRGQTTSCAVSPGE